MKVILLERIGKHGHIGDEVSVKDGFARNFLLPPGRALRALVINKLPFKVPSEPLTAARLERLAEEGQDGFVHYLLPHAALKLKQGFGRLIRSRKDLGVVVLLDSRAVTKRYGPMLLGGLPRAERVAGAWSQVRTKCEDFFARHGIGATV